MTDRLKRFRSRGRRYAETLRWLIADALRHFRYRFLAIVAGQFVGTSCQAGALAALLFYIDHLERGVPITVPRSDYTVDPAQVFGSVALGCFVLLVIGGLLTFMAKRQTIELSLRYEDMFGRRLLGAIGVVPTEIRDGSGPLSRVIMNVRRAHSRDSLHAARSLRILLRGSGQLITFAYASLAAVYLSPIGFGIILAAIFGFAGLYYWANVYAARSAKRLELVRPKANQRWNAAAEALRLRGGTVDPDDPVIARTYNSAPMCRTRESFEGRLSAPVYSELFGNLGLAFALLSAIFFMGVPAMKGVESWSFVLAFVMAVQFAMVSFRGVIQSLTSFARLYPGSRRCFDICRSDVQGRRGEDSAGHAIPVCPSAQRNPEGVAPAVEIRPGQAVALITCVEPTRYSLGALLYVMAGGDETVARRVSSSAAIVAAPFSTATTCSLRAALAPPALTSGAKVDALLTRSGLAASFRDAMDADPDRLLSPRRWRGAPRELQARVALARACLADARFVFLHRAVLAAAGGAKESTWLELFDNKIVFIYDVVTGQSVPPAREAPILIVGDGGVMVLSGADELSEKSDDVLRMLKDMRYRDQGKAGVSDDNGEEEE